MRRRSTGRLLRSTQRERQPNAKSFEAHATDGLKIRIFAGYYHYPPMTLHVAQLDELNEAAHRILADGRDRSVWLFQGDMGAGKTTLIKLLCHALGVISTVQSPTFSIVNEYTTHEGHSVYHFDCYRLRNEAEALDIGIEEYFDSGDYCFIEWPERITSLWPATYYQVTLSVNADGSRTIETERVD